MEKELLKQILANQIVIFKLLHKMEERQHGTTTLGAGNDYYAKELKREAEQSKPHITI
jgi:hypothetical protein